MVDLQLYLGWCNSQRLINDLHVILQNTFQAFTLNLLIGQERKNADFNQFIQKFSLISFIFLKFLIFTKDLKIIFT